MRTGLVRRIDASEIPPARFFRLVAHGLLAGAFAAASLGAAATVFTVSVAAVFSDGKLELVFGALHLAVMIFVATSVVSLFLALIPFGPVAYLLAHFAYRRGMRDRWSYAALGAGIATLIPALIGLFIVLTAGIGGLISTSLVTAVLTVGWFAASGARGGAAFARALNEEERREEIGNVF